jgi:large subunit ribosomal protein L10
LDKKQKQEELASLKEMMARANQIIVTDHTGINVADFTILRRKLKAVKSEIRVSKNTLLKLAAKDTPVESLNKHFAGVTSVVFGYDDPALPAKIINESMKEIEKPKFKAYYMGGNVYGIDTLKKIAELPPRPVVLAMLISTVEGPIVKFIMMLDAAAQEFVGTLEALIKSKES